ncbi:DNA-directed RNA polymerase III subunit RPC7 isoform X2 [Alosa sapidissima]|uniref:DNA-directed RNA polymerase III subunit RPC7 isoform X2 n=1 Tax=Alosa sapidissima TaxID=34773 RepID=UPI001C0A4506|nr:DNA-directed RNA polymerase III subunit RPC7 isoform X2 [Alosa sapidissima]
MAGGRGRGMAAFSFRVENLGITRGNMPDGRKGPNPLYPAMEYKPVALELSQSDDYMLALKQEIRGTMRKLPCYLKANVAKSEVEKYKDKYVRESQKIEDEEWTPVSKKKPRTLTSLEKDGLLSKLSELEKTDNVNADEEKEEEKEEKKKGEDDAEDGEEIEGEEYDDEDLEEENDYIASYFEDGDDFGAGSDDNMDGEATY